MADRELMKRYFLGMVSDGERASLENEYLSSHDVFEELTEAQTDLVDSYARGRLSDLEKQKFEKRYLTSAVGRARVGFSLALSDVAAERQSPSERKVPFRRTLLNFFQQFTVSARPKWGIVGACAVALIIAIVSFRSSHNEDRRAVSAPPPVGDGMEFSAKNAYVRPQTPAIKNNPEGREIASLEKPALGEFTLQLEPGASRALGSAGTFVAPAAVSFLNLQLGVDDENHLSYVAQVDTADGTEVRRVGGLTSRLVSGRRVVIVRLPAHLIPPGDYVLELKALAEDQKTEESVESYSFRLAYR